MYIDEGVDEDSVAVPEDMDKLKSVASTELPPVWAFTIDSLKTTEIVELSHETVVPVMIGDDSFFKLRFASTEYIINLFGL